MTAQDVAREILPTLNACLNGTSGALVLAAFVAIRAKRIALHRALMLGALGCSTAFLASYLTRVALTGSTPFAGEGVARVVYLLVLLSHMALAIVVVPMVLVTLAQSLRQRFPQHRKIARWTLPIWLYVSVTGVVVYLMLYHWPVTRPEPVAEEARSPGEAALHTPQSATISASRGTLAALTCPDRPTMVGPREGVREGSRDVTLPSEQRRMEGKTR